MVFGLPKFSANVLNQFDPPAWVDGHLKPTPFTPHTFPLPTTFWTWTYSEWLVDMNDDVDEQGQSFHSHCCSFPLTTCSCYRMVVRYSIPVEALARTTGWLEILCSATSLDQGTTLPTAEHPLQGAQPQHRHRCPSVTNRLGSSPSRIFFLHFDDERSRIRCVLD